MDIFIIVQVLCDGHNEYDGTQDSRTHLHMK